ncbi:MAG: hypothetical protein GXP27_00110 [Planctomycetes bacterium]|nr:hypothetical protein [Planctomycetota bacterium]
MIARAVLLVLWVGLQVQVVGAAEEVSVADQTWKAPLAVKADRIEAGIQKRHNILGLYPSMVEIPPDGGPIDITTTNPFADIQHAVCWTSNYLAGLSFRVAFLEKSGAPKEEVEKARRRADEVFEAVYRCQRVTGVRGLQARGYFLGHGETYAEKHAGAGKLPYWRQGKADGMDFRWVGDPSHHNYSDAIHGLGQYYDLAAKGKQKERARQAIDDLVSYWVDNDLKIAKYDRSLPAVPILGVTDGKTLNTRVFMAIAGARVAYYATGKAKFKAVFDRLVEQYGLRGLKKFTTDKNFDDAEHCFCHLDLLWRIEDDPELRAAYRKIADGLWANHKDDGQSLFTYIYFAIAPDAPGKKKALSEALFSLQTFPTDMTIKPRMNSLYPQLKPPYPTYLAAWDNEYIWKGNLLRPDGWLSRIVTDVAVSGEDPMVLFAVDQAGGLYQSRDGAATWQNWRPIDQNLPSSARAVAAGRRNRIVAVAGSDGFYLTVTGGAQWKRLPLPPDAGSPRDVFFDTENPNRLYAVTDRGVYRSRDFGADYIGESWECLTESLPALRNVRWAVIPGQPGRLFAVTEKQLFTRTFEEPEWIRRKGFGLDEYGRLYPWVVADPRKPDRLFVVVKTTEEDVGTLTILQETTDAGRSWSNDLMSLFQVLSKLGLPGLIAAGIPMDLNCVLVDPDDSNLLFAGTNQGVLLSTNGGKTWQLSRHGLEIPVVRTLIRPAHSKWLFAGTPGGLYISKDHGRTWQDGNLWLQFTKNTRRELGGAAFVDAYWRARYYGFIDERQALAPCDRE